MAALLDRLEKAVSDEESFELWDILEEMKPGDKDKIEENVEYVLKREKLLPKGGSVLIPMGSWDWEIEDGRWEFWALFEIFEKGGWDMVAHGKVTATGQVAQMPRMRRKRWGPAEDEPPIIQLHSIDVGITEVFRD